ncbi:MAG TPA: tetratricopeptide repeat protein [Opitutaceae bacterium]|nr:tetratricopeptide repeat protein [Opitutaceae bacterium]
MSGGAGSGWRRVRRWGPLVLLAAGLAAYSGSLSGPFVFDDGPAIEQNLTIRRLASSLAPPAGALPVSGRPLLNLSFALNYAAGGLGVGSYHAVNLAIHLLAGLALFGLVRRTLAGPDDEEAGMVALGAALLWLLHPLQTEAVTYVSQRAESLMGLLYLFTLYAWARGAREEKRAWLGAAVAACAAGMLTKEVMASAPVFALLYDRTFVAGSFAAAWRRRRGAYLALASTWLLLALSVALGGADRGGTSALAFQRPWTSYWLTQPEAVVHYLRLALLPHPLVLYYQPVWATARQALPYAAAVLALGGAAAWALWRRPAAGFLGAWFFAGLAPTSLVPNDMQTIAEHRMYLPLAAVAVGAALALSALAGRRRAPALCGILALALGAGTARRNAAYASKVALWSDTVAKRPENSYAHNNLGEALFERGDLAGALAQYREAERLRPGAGSIYAILNRGITLEAMGRLPEAMAAYREGAAAEPTWAGPHLRLGDALNRAGRLAEAEAEYRAALRLRPGDPQAEYGLGNLRLRAGDPAAAAACFQAAVRGRPGYAEAWDDLGTALAASGRLPEAISAYRRAIELKPGYPEARYSLGNVYYQMNRIPDALACYEEALRRGPGTPEARYHYGVLLAQAGRLDEAEKQLQEALRLKPGSPEIEAGLRQLRAMPPAAGRPRP